MTAAGRARPSLELAPGEPCVIFRSSRNGYGGGSIKPDTIARVTQRDVVTASGERFRKDRLVRSNGEWTLPTELLPPDHPRVQSARQANALSHRIAAVRNAIEQAERALGRRDLDGALSCLRAIVEGS